MKSGRVAGRGGNSWRTGVREGDRKGGEKGEVGAGNEKARRR